MFLEVVSGGQTGADQGALEAALRLGLHTHGHMPAGYKTETGPRPDLAALYGLTESGGGYGTRDRENIDCLRAGDGVLALRYSVPRTGAGTNSTLHYALTGQYELHEYVRVGDSSVDFYTSERKVHAAIVWDLCEDTLNSTVLQLASVLPDWGSKLLVTGPCESTSPGVQALTARLLERVYTLMLRE